MPMKVGKRREARNRQLCPGSRVGRSWPKWEIPRAGWGERKEVYEVGSGRPVSSKNEIVGLCHGPHLVNLVISCSREPQSKSG